MSASQEALRDALQISARMIAAAEREEWQQVLELDAQRQPLLAGPWSNSDASREGLTALLEQNLLLQERAREAHTAVARQLGGQRQAHHALRSYITNSR